MLHGHSHGTLRRQLPHRFDVGVDTNFLRPYDFDWLLAKAATQRFEPTDHHGNDL